MFVLGSVHLTAADGPGDRFIIGESQAGEQVRFIGRTGPKDFSFVDLQGLILISTTIVREILENH